MKDIHLANVHVEYEHRKNWHKIIIEMTTLTDNIFEFNKHPASIDYVKKALPTSKKQVRFRVRKIELIKKIGKSFYYE
tara:strand:- start:15 stop:248 length:234 start_codon:yes stop_codon:yes gene_type:complete